VCAHLSTCVRAPHNLKETLVLGRQEITQTTIELEQTKENSYLQQWNGLIEDILSLGDD